MNSIAAAIAREVGGAAHSPLLLPLAWRLEGAARCEKKELITRLGGPL
jgi:hypothetical protein